MTRMQIFLSRADSISSGYIPRSGTAESYGHSSFILFIFIETLCYFLKRPYSFTISQMDYKDSLFFQTYSPILVITLLFDNSNLNRCIMIHHFSFCASLTINVVEYIFIYLFICVSSYENFYSSLLFIFHFFICFCFLILLLSEVNSLYIFNIN